MEKLSCADKEWGSVPIAFTSYMLLCCCLRDKREENAQLDGNQKVVRGEALGGFF